MTSPPMHYDCRICDCAPCACACERDEDGLDVIEALVADAAAAEPSRMVHEGGEYYAERIIRRAIAQGNLALAAGAKGNAQPHPKAGQHD
jgi:hypothetical protein